MNKEIVGGSLLITGTLLTILLMLMHPTGHDLSTNYAQMARVNVMVHSIALSALPMIFLGLLSARRRLGASDATNAALTTYAMASIAWMFSAVTSGFVQTELYARMLEAEGSSLELLKELSRFTHYYNQGFAKLGVAASSISIGLFSWAILRGTGLGRWLGWIGVVMAAGLVGALAMGLLSLDVKGFGLIMLCQGLWLFCLGLGLLSPRASAAASPNSN